MTTWNARKPRLFRLLPDRWPWQPAEKISESEKLDQFLASASPREMFASLRSEETERKKSR